MQQPADPLGAYLDAVSAAIAGDRFVRVVLSKPMRAEDDAPRRVDARRVTLKNEPRLLLTAAHATRDLTRNVPIDAATEELRTLLADPGFGHARLDTSTGAKLLRTSRKGRRTLLTEPPAPAAAGASPAPSAAAHDRAKHRLVPLDRPYLAALGIVDAGGRLVPAMARKWKQIDKFVELLDGALTASGLDAAGAERLDVIDFGCGKGYLTFAAHDHLRRVRGLPAQVTGVELRGELVDFCNAAAQRLGLDGLRFEQGDVRSIVPPSIDVMVALHACDTATDHAIATGVAAGAKVIVCSPCCHKELRPQLAVPQALRPLLKHGVHLGQEAEMLTDALRALALEACGYDARVLEFVALEHTNKNKMILATRRSAAADAAGPASPRAAEAARQLGALKDFYGIREQCLARLLADRLSAAAALR